MKTKPRTQISKIAAWIMLRVFGNQKRIPYSKGTINKFQKWYVNYSIITTESITGEKQLCYNGTWFHLYLKEALSYFWLSSSLGFLYHNAPRASEMLIQMIVFTHRLLNISYYHRKSYF